MFFIRICSFLVNIITVYLNLAVAGNVTGVCDQLQSFKLLHVLFLLTYKFYVSCNR